MLMNSFFKSARQNCYRLSLSACAPPLPSSSSEGEDDALETPRSVAVSPPPPPPPLQSKAQSQPAPKPAPACPPTVPSFPVSSFSKPAQNYLEGCYGMYQLITNSSLSEEAKRAYFTNYMGLLLKVSQQESPASPPIVINNNIDKQRPAAPSPRELRPSLNDFIREKELELLRAERERERVREGGVREIQSILFEGRSGVGQVLSDFSGCEPEPLLRSKKEQAVPLSEARAEKTWLRSSLVSKEEEKAATALPKDPVYLQIRFGDSNSPQLSLAEAFRNRQGKMSSANGLFPREPQAPKAKVRRERQEKAQTKVLDKSQATEQQFKVRLARSGSRTKMKDPPAQLINRLINGQRAKVGLREAIQSSSKQYQRLPEMRAKQLEEERRQDLKRRLLARKEFEKKVRQRGSSKSASRG